MPPRPPIRTKDPDLSRVVALIGSPERAALGRIVATLPVYSDALPTATLAIRWALLELNLRLESDEGPLAAPPK